MDSNVTFTPVEGNPFALSPKEVQSMVARIAQEQGVDPDLALRIAKQESGFNPDAVSPKGARGVMQLMPGTAKDMGVSDPHDPEQNIAGGVKYLAQLNKQFAGKEDLVRAAYHSGPDTVSKGGLEALGPAGKDYVAKTAPNRGTQIAAERQKGVTFTPVDFDPFDTTPHGSDIPALLGQGAAAVVQGITYPLDKLLGGKLGKVFEDHVGRNLNDIMNDVQQTYQAKLSPEQQAAGEKKFISDKEGEVFGEAWSDPKAYKGLIVSNLPSMLPGFGAAALASRGARVYGTMAARAALESGMAPELAAKAGQEAAVKAAGRIGAVAGGATEGILGGGQQGAQTESEIMAMREDKLQQSQFYQGLLQTMSPKEAREQIAHDAGTQAMLIAGVVDGVTGGAFDAYLAKTLTGGGSGSLLREIGRGMAKEGATETAQSGGEQLATNIGVRSQADPTRPLGQDVANQAVQGGIAGGAMGVGAGGGAHAGAQPLVTPPGDAGGGAPTQPPPSGPQEPPKALGFQAGPPLVTFPDGTTMTQAEYQQRQADGMTGSGPQAAGAEPQQPTGQFQGTYRDGTNFGISFETEQRTDGTFTLVRVISDADGERTEHLTQEGSWAKGRPARTAVFGAHAEETAPESFPTAEAAMAAGTAEAKEMGAAPQSSSPSLSPIDQARTDAQTLKASGYIPGADPTRQRNAQLVATYGENAAVRHVIDGGLDALGEAMLRAAPTVERVRGTIQNNEKSRDITDDILQAVEEIGKAKTAGHDVSQILAEGVPHDMSFEGQQLMQFLAENANNSQRIASFLENYLQEVENATGIPSQVRGRAFDIIQERNAARKAQEEKAKEEAFKKAEKDAAKSKAADEHKAGEKKKQESEQAGAERVLRDIAVAKAAGHGLVEDVKTTLGTAKVGAIEGGKAKLAARRQEESWQARQKAKAGQGAQDKEANAEAARTGAFEAKRSQEAIRRTKEEAAALVQKTRVEQGQRAATETQAREQNRADQIVRELAVARAAGSGINPEHKTAMELAFAGAKPLKGKNGQGPNPVQRGPNGGPQGGQPQKPAGPAPGPVSGAAAPGNVSDSRPVRPVSNPASAGAAPEAAQGAVNRGQAIAAERRVGPGGEVHALAMQAQREAGWNSAWPFIPADLFNADFRGHIRNDPGISESEKTQILTAGHKLGVVPTNELPAPHKTPVDAAAHEAATSPHNELPAPSTAQILAGNATLGHPKVGGLDISIESPEGSIREDKHNTPPKWSRRMEGAHYGYVRGVPARAPDKEHVDVFVKPGTPEDYNGPVFVVDQNHPNGNFDEPKSMVGFKSMREARAAYLKNYTKGWEKNVRGITEMTMGQFKEKLQDESAFLKPQRETLNVLDIPADLKITLPVTVESNGQTVNFEPNARAIFKDRSRKVNRLQSLLDCLR